MRPQTWIFALLAAATAAPAIGQAASSALPNQSDASNPVEARPAAVRPLSLMNLSPTKPLARPYQSVGFEPREDKMPVAVSYQPRTGGPVGSVGVICRPISHALNDTPVGATSEGQPGSESQSLGANFAYTFR
ncbi:MAG TPA: hypothetical protein VGG92_07230 [Caulobacteraceae bacterium]